MNLIHEHSNTVTYNAEHSLPSLRGNISERDIIDDAIDSSQGKLLQLHHVIDDDGRKDGDYPRSCKSD